MAGRKRKASTAPFGSRLAEIRKAKGLTQTELGELIGASQRMVAYYEKETQRPPSEKLHLIAKALNISMDELLGIKETKSETSPKQAALWKRLRKIEALPQSQQKTLLKTIDTFLKGAEK